MDNIVLRTATPSDLDGLFALYQAEQWTNFTKEKVAAMLEASASIWLVLEEAGEIIGFARYITDGVETTFIGEIIVAKSHRRQGLGRRLIEEIEARQPATRIELASEEDGFYKALGFIPIGSALRLRK
ncbi:GNAT family N-acetyltransferase [Streptococcus massiliensis]|uniref:GNAT family acetyltransferase n=2 Tax=Streptococcus massiliensis TaxID=313439 RepID=A0A380KYY1_9STRE|nr:GNAT family N-acetyltransferase [Streptococcus massiliensis]SUN75770.1 GNAT family acetyltransferase [Streptococcus massiliensis]